MKPVEVSLDLDDDLRASILMMGVKLPDGSYKTIEDLVAIADLALAQANDALLKNPLARRAALAEMKRKGKRGYPVFTVATGGSTSLLIHYDPLEGAPELPRLLRKKSGLPSLDELREEAETRSIDISDLGRQKHLIIERLRAATSDPVSEKQ